MYDPEVADKIFDLGKTGGLTIEQIGFLGEEIGYVFLGLTRPEEFVLRLRDRLKLVDEETRQLAEKANRQVLLPLREALKQAHNIDVSETGPAAGAPLVPGIPPRPAPPQIPPIDLRTPKPQPMQGGGIFFTPPSQESAPEIKPEPPKPSAGQGPNKDDPYREPAE